MHRVSHSHPRVYLTDFETAIQFSEGEAFICYGLPVGGPIDPNSYGRSSPDDVLSGLGYNPFPVDVWQFFTGLEQLGFKVGDTEPRVPDFDFLLLKCSNPEISEVLATFHPSDPNRRVSAEEAYNALASLVDNVPPISLLANPSIDLSDD